MALPSSSFDMEDTCSALSLGSVVLLGMDTSLNMELFLILAIIVSGIEPVEAQGFSGLDIKDAKNLYECQ